MKYWDHKHNLKIIIFKENLIFFITLEFLCLLPCFKTNNFKISIYSIIFQFIIPFGTENVSLCSIACPNVSYWKEWFSILDIYSTDHIFKNNQHCPSWVQKYISLKDLFDILWIPYVGRSAKSRASDLKCSHTNWYASSGTEEWNSI